MLIVSVCRVLLRISHTHIYTHAHTHRERERTLLYFHYQVCNESCVLNGLIITEKIYFAWHLDPTPKLSLFIAIRYLTQL